MKPKVAVIILNWNGAKLLREFLPSVIENTSQSLADVIVADNNSADDSMEYVQNSFPNLRIIRFPENYGYAEGYNKAIAQCAEYKYCVLLNSDVKPCSGWIEPLLEVIEADESIAALQPKILSYTHPEQFEYAGACGGFIDKHGFPFCRGRILDTTETDTGQYDSPTEIFWASGAALFIRTDVYIETGGLDKEFFAHMEEIDLCWRIHNAGYKIMVIPQSMVYHLGGGSLPASNPRKTYLNFRNNLLLLHKNIPQSQRTKVLFIRRLYDTVAFAAFVAKGEFANARAVLKAHHDFRSMRRKFYSDESMCEASTNLLGKFPHTQRNIITDYYLHNRKYFNK